MRWRLFHLLVEGRMIKITKEPLLIDKLISYVESPDCGAIATFAGTVRNHSNGKKVLYLEYEAYPEMVEAKLKEIKDEVFNRWDVSKIAMAHRVGRLEIGEPSVMIAVSAAHRKPALEACHYAIDRLKEIVPIWKKEVFEDGEVWVGTGCEVATSRNPF